MADLPIPPEQLKTARMYGVFAVLCFLASWVFLPAIVISIVLSIMAYKKGAHRFGAICIIMNAILVGLMILGGLVIFSYGIVQSSPTFARDFRIFTILVFLLNVLLPSVLWIWYLRWLDRLEPESIDSLLKAFLWGLVASLVAIFVEGFVFYFLLGISANSVNIITIVTGVGVSPYILLVLLGSGFIEEIVNYLFVKRIITTNPEVNQIADGAYYAMTLALGFAFLENAGYFISFASQGFQTLLSASLVRASISTLLHITATGFVGYQLARIKFLSPKKSAAGYVFLAGLYHGLFDVFLVVTQGTLLAIFSPIIVLVAFYFLIRQIHKPENQKIMDAAVVPNVS